MTITGHVSVADKVMDEFGQWAAEYPAARFVAVAVAPAGSDAEELGWGLALPDYVFTYLPAISVTGRFSTAGDLLRMLRRGLDARLVWIDPEPEYWADEVVST
jgi:hypothetical protein